MKKIMQRMAIWGIILCFCAALFPAEALAAKHKDKKNRYENHQYDRRHERIIINTIHIDDRHFGYAKKSRLTLRDLIVAKAIADESRYLDTEDVLRMMMRGESHKRIAKKYHINWRNVDKRLNDAHKDMKREAIKLGLALWALDEIIN